MSLLVRNDEQIQVGVTTGLVAGSSSFTFDGTNGTPDYRFFEPTFTEIGGRGILIKNVNYTWVAQTGIFTLLALNDVFAPMAYYNVHFQPVTPPAMYSPLALINVTFFILDINQVNTGYPAVSQKINAAISKYQPKCLKGILGYALFSVLMTESSQRMQDLIFGRDYLDHCGDLQHWDGLVYDDNQSLIADYVYYMLKDMDATFTTGVSTSTTNTESGFSTSPDDKMVDSWNSFSRRTKQLLSFLWNMNNTQQVSPPVISLVKVYPEFTDRSYRESRDFSKHINVFGI